MNNSKSDFTQGSILGKLLPFMMPILGALVLQAAYGAVDLLVVGRFGTTSGLSAVSTGSQVLNLVTFVITQFAMGITVLIARYIGEKKPQYIGALIGGATIIFAIVSAVLFVIMIGFSQPIAVLMQAPEEAVELTSTYVRICGGGIFFIVAYNLLAAIFRGLGDSKSPLLFVAVACVVNIAGDLILVAGLHLDAAGAAIATVAAQAVSVVFALFLLVKRELPFEISKHDFKINMHCVRALKIGLPLALQEFLTQISFLALCAFVNRLGLEASSGYGVACKIVNFAMLIPSSLMQSMASFVSQNVGAGNEKRAKKAMFTGMGVGLVIGCIVFTLVWFKGNLLTGIFTTDAAVVQNGYDYLKGFALETIVTAILFSIIGYFNGHDKTVWVMVQGLVQTLLVRLPLAYYMSIQPDASLTKIGFAAPAATIFGIVLNVIYYLYANRKQQ
ncbi:MATE family efflux transporter [Roseburia sp. AM23-20]|uniref:MATE family efflux transporter n=1 Tax=unclassified Roseburia TaxID=2637578 RepID=UPI000E4DB55F|nr:MATE family efflux transporter [Roseburia sp. AM23-20]RHF96141.1 MATE family efflux transporter [Roseburia sp. AM23-20]